MVNFEDLKTPKKNTWCPQCGNFGILIAFKQALIELNLENRAKVIEVIRKMRPRLVLVPYWSDRHPDHVAAAQLIKKAIFDPGLAVGLSKTLVCRFLTFKYPMMPKAFAFQMVERQVGTHAIALRPRATSSQLGVAARLALLPKRVEGPPDYLCGDARNVGADAPSGACAILPHALRTSTGIL